MADTMQFDLVSPERSLHSAQVEKVQIHGEEGEMTVMPNHAPVLTLLRPGFLTVTENGQSHDYVVSNGFAEIGPEGVSVLVEQATSRDGCTTDWIDRVIDEAEKAALDCADDQKITLNQRVNHARFLKQQLGL
ncbi:ATP synthase F1 subunit epsilon [Pontivivens ytuae]|uniref:ATP synthase epsilon chain n=1 Tax=Pontivivens ytuae TaxID=2789856 RepID=A0A7S9QEU1_9RHOB|nr:ATP synthase F1 subunit epsilon [Pontivivens ytuae]QPH55807.1 ATP synthase F1 subunit epsilon [Pontivivens ytuae]